jgi:hypothetical protein
VSEALPTVLWQWQPLFSSILRQKPLDLNPTIVGETAVNKTMRRLRLRNMVY